MRVQHGEPGYLVKGVGHLLEGTSKSACQPKEEDCQHKDVVVLMMTQAHPATQEEEQ